MAFTFKILLSNEKKTVFFTFSTKFLCKNNNYIRELFFNNYLEYIIERLCHIQSSLTK